jgi:hypothetical protein
MTIGAAKPDGASRVHGRFVGRRVTGDASGAFGVGLARPLVERLSLRRDGGVVLWKDCISRDEEKRHHRGEDSLGDPG